MTSAPAPAPTIITTSLTIQPMLNSRDQDKKKKTYLYRSPDHIWSKCPHLFEWNRVLGFKVDTMIQKQIKEKRAKSKIVKNSI